MTLAYDPSHLSRRTLCAGLTGAALLWQPQSTAAQEAELPEPASGQLFLNLFTRLAFPVRLNGHRESRFVIDTGAQATSVSDRLARDMGFDTGPPLTIHTATASSIVPSAIIPELRVADALYPNVIAPVFAAESLGAEGLLGLNHLAQFRLTLDQRRRRATLGRPTRPEATIESLSHTLRSIRTPPLAPVPTQAQRGLLFLEITVGHIRTTAFLDTGAQYSVGNLALLNALPRTGDRQPAQLRAVSGPPVTVSTGPSVSLTMGQRRLQEVPLLYGDLHIMEYLGLSRQPALMIGADIMGRFERIRIDYSHNEVSLGSILARRQ